jgi:hypothetical protein
MSWRRGARNTLLVVLLLAPLSQIRDGKRRVGNLFTETKTLNFERNSSNASVLSTIEKSLYANLSHSTLSLKSTYHLNESIILQESEILARAPRDANRLCTRNEIQQGEWIPVTLHEMPYISVPLGNRCPSNLIYKAGKPWQTWDWQPFSVKAGNCTLLHWNASHFCSLARFATIAIVGDSTSFEQYFSLVRLLGQTTKNKKVQEALRIHYVCRGQVRLVYLRDNTLQHFTNVLKNALSPNILILNRGAHYTENAVLKSELQNLTVQLKVWQESCASSQRLCHLLVRTSVPGHPHCWNFTKPAKSVKKMEEHVADESNYNVSNHYLNWREFKRQNELSLRVYEQANLTFDVVDAYHINILRPDQHLEKRNDCLHSCYPGKMDVYNQLLLHFLQKMGGVAATNADWVNQTMPTR